MNKQELTPNTASTRIHALLVFMNSHKDNYMECEFAEKVDEIRAITHFIDNIEAENERPVIKSKVVKWCKANGFALVKRAEYKEIKALTKEQIKKEGIEGINKRVAESTGITVEALIGGNRFTSVKIPRQIAQYIADVVTPFSHLIIGNRTGGKDRNTVRHACEVVAIWISDNKDFYNKYEELFLMYGIKQK
jgi:chromosomal replication initiation ATPase DnaA